jgi:hypothetical protein
MSILTLQLEVRVDRDIQYIKKPDYKSLEILKIKKRTLRIHKWASLPPILRKVSAWVWARRAFYCQATWSRVINALRIMSSSSAFECHQIPPDPKDSMDLLVSILSGSFMSSK